MPTNGWRLVIGNSAYRNVTALPNTTNDANDIAMSFGRLGFSVSKVMDGTFDDMRRALLKFGRDARGSEMAVVFFAGHGMEIGGENWLIPIDAELRSDTDAESEAIPLRSAMLQVANASSLGLVILDSCRNNPFAAKMQHTSRYRAVDRGLARVEPTDNVLVAYAAKDGTTANDGNGRNSPFTAALLNNLETPGIEIRFLLASVRDEVMASTKREQQPFVYGSLSRQSIYLKAVDDQKPPVAQPQPPSQNDPCGDARAHWQSTETIGTIAAYEDHLARFANCAFAGLAHANLEALKSKKNQTAVASAPLPKDEPEAVRSDRKAAEGGNPDFMVSLGFRYERGNGVAKDEAEAVRWYHKAADAGQALAMNNLGTMYRNGAGVAKDDAESIRWFRKAADAGNTPGMVGLATMYRDGRGIAKDDAEAIRWLRKAADAGNGDAMTGIGDMYRDGAGVAKNDAEAVRWYRKAADAGNEYATAALKRLDR
jgi:hypothetical protein